MFRNTHGVVFIDIKQQLFRNPWGGIHRQQLFSNTRGVVFMDSSCLGTPVVVFMDSSWRRETAKTPSGSGFKLFCRIQDCSG